MNIATNIASSPLMLNESKNFYILVLSVIRTALTREFDLRELNEDSRKAIEHIRARSELALAFIHMENE